MVHPISEADVPAPSIFQYFAIKYCLVGNHERTTLLQSCHHLAVGSDSAMSLTHIKQTSSIRTSRTSLIIPRRCAAVLNTIWVPGLGVYSSSDITMGNMDWAARLNGVGQDPCSISKVHNTRAKNIARASKLGIKTAACLSVHSRRGIRRQLKSIHTIGYSHRHGPIQCLVMVVFLPGWLNSRHVIGKPPATDTYVT